MSLPELYQFIQTYLEQHQSFYLDLLRQMVAINSFTANPVGVNALGDLTAAAFANLGFVAERVQSTHPIYGQHLVLTRTGRSGRKIGLVSHLDTVFPPDEELRHNFFWRQEGDRIYGPGTVDIKGGTVVIYMMMAALQAIQPEVYDDITWVILLNASEEDLTKDFGKLCLERLAGETLACLVFEGGHQVDQVWAIVVARKGRATYHVTVEGKGAHAGSSHREGANAIVQLAQVVQNIALLTDYERDLTFNVGTIAGGTVINRVPHYAAAAIEMRAFSPEVFDQGLASILALTGQSTVKNAYGDYACQVKVELLQQTAPWARNEASDRLLAIWQEAAASLGQKVVPEARGGLSDGNRTWRHIPTIDGLGPAGGNSHCSEQSADGRKEQEYVLASSFTPKALLNTAAVLKLVESQERSNR